MEGIQTKERNESFYKHQQIYIYIYALNNSKGIKKEKQLIEIKTSYPLNGNLAYDAIMTFFSINSERMQLLLISFFVFLIKFSTILLEL